MTTTTTTTPRIYVASLSDYNDGTLHGCWIDADQDADEIMAEVTAMLAGSPTARRDGMPAEEWAIHDHEGFCGWRPGEWESFETVAEIGQAIASADDEPALTALLGHDDDALEAVRTFADRYSGRWDSVADWAREYAAAVGALRVEQAYGDPVDLETRWPFDHIDWAAAGRDLADGYDIVEAGGEVYIFLPLDAVR